MVRILFPPAGNPMRTWVFAANVRDRCAPAGSGAPSCAQAAALTRAPSIVSAAMLL